MQKIIVLRPFVLNIASELESLVSEKAAGFLNYRRGLATARTY